jgi:hypothetical protein
MAQRRGFVERGGGKRWNPKRPYHVALEDNYAREHWFAIDAVCKLNSLPFNATGEKIQRDGTWCVYEFTWQMDAILFWHRFQGRWLRGDEFHYPEAPQNLPPLRDLPRHPYDKRRPNAKRRRSKVCGATKVSVEEVQFSCHPREHRGWRQPMRATGLSALLIVLPLAGFFEATSRPPGLGEAFMSKEQLAAKDDAICQGYGAKPGSDVYIECRVTQDQRRDAVRNSPDALSARSGGRACVRCAAPSKYNSTDGQMPDHGDANGLPVVANPIREMGLKAMAKSASRHSRQA